LDATCIRSGLGDVTSVDAEMFAELCEVAASARLKGEPDTPREVACAYRRSSTLLGPADAAGENDSASTPPHAA
jgi:hypothetical protein